MTIKFAFILFSTAIVHVCGWNEFGQRTTVDTQLSTNLRRRKSSIWDEARQRPQRIYRIREDLVFEESLQYESLLDMVSFSISMSMITSSRPTASPVHLEPPPFVIPTASPTVAVPSSGPTVIPTTVPSDEPTNSPVHTEPPQLVIPTVSPTIVVSSSGPTAIPTAVLSDEPTTSPVHTEPPPLILPTSSPTLAAPPSSSGPTTIPTKVPSDEPTNSPVHTEPPPLILPTAVPTDEPTEFPTQPTALLPGASQSPTGEVSMEPTVTPIPTSTRSPTVAPTTAVPTASPAPTLSPSLTPSQKPSISSSPTESPRPSASSNPSSPPSTSQAPTLSPSMAPSPKPSVSMFPTLSQSPSSSGMPSGRPSESSAPTTSAAPTLIPTILDPSLVETFAPSSQSQTTPTVAFDCLDNDILSLGDASDVNTTLINLFVGYHVESSSNSTDDYLAELEQSLLLTAVAAALGCNRPDLRRRNLMEARNRNLLKQSTIIDSVPCNTTVDGAVSCTTIETDLVFFLKGEVDPDTAEFSGYSAIRDKMTDDEYIGKIPTVLKLIYKSPLPLPAPPQVNEDPNNNNGDNEGLNARNVKLQVSPWTIGACVASVFGGAVSFLVWSRNRRSRHHRHIQLVDDCSMMETSSRNPVSV
ncbi:unnamed protein product [Cylindrotheca closterium]|uniref:Uncharacterized protein n=1 Tax=Cylindrotheca closterium TaxID=2856 RepID=A0AAD2G3X4_9STRA|nr:unnamed protein product [Cylindrotheca closterium]